MQKLKEKDALSWDKAIKEHGQRVRNLVWPLVPREDVEDVCQEVWLQAYASVDKFRGDCAFTTWLHSLAVNTATSWFNRSIRGGNKLSIDDLVSDHPYSLPVENNFDAYLTKLSDEDKTIFTLYYVHGYSQQEIADLLGFRSSKAVNSRLVRGRSKIKENISHPGHSNS